MLTLKLIFMLLILAYTVYSLIVYLARRGESRHARQQHQTTAPVRRLTPTERNALQQVHEAPLSPLSPVGVPEPDAAVYALSGRYRAHGITVKGHTTWHHTINDVEVVFPFDAEAHATEQCNAEVVYVRNVAVVLKLGDGFDVVSAAERFKQRKVQLDRWQAGTPGPLPPSSDGENLIPSDIEILGQRDETAHEIAERNPRGSGLWAGFVLLLALTGLIVGAAMDEAQAPYWLIGSGLAALGGLTLFWRRPVATPRRVNRVRAPLGIRTFRGTDGVMSAGSLTLGELLDIHPPQRWVETMVQSTHDRPEMDIRVDDNQVLRFQHLSVDKEVQHAPPAFWGRHLTLALVGAGFAAITLGLLSMPFERDARFLLARLLQGETQVITDPGTLQQTPPAANALVTLRGQAQCEVQLNAFDCTRLRWGAETPSVPPPDPDPLVAELTSPQFLAERSVPGAANLARLYQQLQAMGGSPSHNPYLGLMQASTQVLSGLDESVKTVERACADARGLGTTGQDLAMPNALQRACNDFQGLFIDSFEIEDQRRVWADWVKLAHDGEVPDSAVITGSRLGSALRQAAHAIADARVDAQREEFARRVQAAQIGGVLVEVREQGDTSRLPQAPQQVGTREAYTQWQQFVQAGAHDFELTGFLRPAPATASGAPRWVMDAGADASRPFTTALRVAAVALALGLLLVHGLLCLWNLFRASQREERLAAALPLR